MRALFFRTAVAVLCLVAVRANAIAEIPAAQALLALDPARIDGIAKHLTSRELTLPFAPPFDARAFWIAWGKSPDGQKTTATTARQVGPRPPSLKEEHWNAFRETGQRKVFERPYGQRIEWLVFNALAEGINDDGAKLAAIETGFAAILAEPSWCMSAHAMRGHRTWESARQDVDLGATQRAWSLALLDYLLGKRLAPETRARLRSEARERVFTPYLERIRARDQRDWWWMRTSNNWNAVCHTGVLGAALLLLEDPAERAEIAAAWEALAPVYLGGFADDGLCDEGIRYWNYGFGNYLLGAEMLRSATGGFLDPLAQPKIRRIAETGSRMEIGAGIWPAFGDTPLTAKPSQWMLDFAATRFGIGKNSGETAGQWNWAKSLPVWLFVNNAWAQTQEHQHRSDTPAPPISPLGSPVTALPLRDYFSDGGALICRSVPDASVFSVALKGGHNAQSHNHNDLGSFTLVCNGAAILSDLGSDTYVKDTFGPKRYTSGVMNSFGHPVPRVAGQLQRTGKTAVAKILRADFSDVRDTWEIDLTSAYDVPALERLTRTFVFTRADGGRLEIVDRVRFKPGQPQAFGSALVLRPDQKRENATASGFRVGQVEISWSADADTTATILLSEDPVHGIVSGQAPRGTRLGLDFASPVTEATLHLFIAPAR
ncbi:Heparinase II/III-like protein [Opitutaceae bacterium TAV1]|nr:Heparinase II/III-like protein [Opitutaceae bacterium TAV1]